MDDRHPGLEHPRLRSDLVVSETTGADEKSYIVKDPITRRFFRFKEHEGFVAGLLDGATPPEEILRRFEAEFGVALSTASLERFLERVETLCLTDRGLEPGEIARRQRKASTESRLANRLLQFRVKAFDPERLLTAALPYTRFFFTRAFLVAAAAATLAAVVITVLRWDIYVAQARELVKPAAIPTFVLVAVVVTEHHEFAHGFTCKHYGGEVHEMGIVLVYLLPAFYCNVSDAWLLTSKAKRLWVSASGTVFQVFLYGLAAIAWAFLNPATWLSQACAITIAVAGLTALFNFNPLIKLDGYYLLSDYLAIPNLRKRAFAYLGSLVHRAPAGELTPRDRRIYLVYGITAGIYSVGLVVFVVFKLGAFVVSALR